MALAERLVTIRQQCDHVPDESLAKADILFLLELVEDLSSRVNSLYDEIQYDA